MPLEIVKIFVSFMIPIHGSKPERCRINTHFHIVLRPMNENSHDRNTHTGTFC